MSPPPPERRSIRATSRWHTVVELLRHYAHRERWFLLPLVGILVVAALLLVLTSSAGVFAPFVYAVF